MPRRWLSLSGLLTARIACTWSSAMSSETTAIGWPSGSRLLRIHLPARAHGDLAAVLLGLVDDPRDLAVAVPEHVAKEKDRPFDWRQALEQYEEGEGERVGGLGVLRDVRPLIGDERLGQPLPHVALTPHARRTKMIDPQPGGDGREVGLRRLDDLALAGYTVESEERLLDDVLGVAHAPHHPVGDGEHVRPKILVRVSHRRLPGLASTHSALETRQPGRL